MTFCNTCGNYPYECSCAEHDAVVGHTSSGLPVRADGTIVTKLLTPEQRRVMVEALIPKYSFGRKQAGG